MDLVDLLTKNKSDILHELVAGHRDPQRARALVEQLSQTESALATMRPAQGKYVGIEKVRDAMKELFKQSGRPWTEDDLKDEIVDRGGWRRGPRGTIDEARLMVQKSIKQHIYLDGAKKWPLKRINGLIGPAEWPDDLFAAK